MSHRVQKAMIQPVNVVFDYLKKVRKRKLRSGFGDQEKSRIQVWLYEQTDTRIEGVIIGMDEYMNLVIDDAEELSMKKETRKKLGRILLKGDNVTLIMEAPQK